MSNLKTLVVEGSPAMRQLIVFALQRMRGLQIVEANDGVDGLKKLCAQKFDLILMDINMPVMDGLKLISMVRDDPDHKKTPIIILATEGAIEDRERAMALGASAYITKPIQTTQMLTTVKRLVDI